MAKMKILVFLCIFTLTVTNLEARIAKSVRITPSENLDPHKSILDIIKPTAGPNDELDLAFIMDSTGSMSSYIRTAKDNIRKIVKEITESSKSDIRLALIEYRDHPPQDKTFVTKTHDFTAQVSLMESWLNDAKARGGGDGPEAVAEAMFETKKLTWRDSATKIAVMISDAPPHGLVPSEDRSFKDGSPNGHDPIQIARDLAQTGVTLYVIGCEPSIVPYKDFFMALAYITGGQYVPLSVPRLLVNAITGGAQEELSLQKFEGQVKAELQKVRMASAPGATIDTDKIANNVFRKLQKSGATTTKVVLNDKALEGPTAAAKKLAQLNSMAEVRKVFKKGSSPVSSRPSLSGALGGRTFLRKSFGGFGGGRMMSKPAFAPEIASSPVSTKIDSISTVKSGISLEQVKRLVQKGTAGLKL